MDKALGGERGWRIDSACKGRIPIGAAHDVQEHPFFNHAWALLSSLADCRQFERILEDRLIGVVNPDPKRIDGPIRHLHWFVSYYFDRGLGHAVGRVGSGFVSDIPFFSDEERKLDVSDRRVKLALLLRVVYTSELQIGSVEIVVGQPFPRIIV